jgi:glycosyltransferase involved in cell wall biosynthesis
VEDRLSLVQPQTSVVPWYDLMDVVLLTSAFEGSPNICLEAQALGIPVVATDAGGAGETFLPDRTGLLVQNSAGPGEIADAVVRVLRDDGWARAAAAAGREHAIAYFGMDRMLVETARLYGARC